MRRRAVKILRRTCWRNGNNFFAASRRRTSASAIALFTRLLSCPSGRWSRHLFLFLFWLFVFPAENSSFLSRLFRRSSTRRLALCFYHGFDLKNKLCRHIVVQLDRNLVVAGIFDWTFQNNFMPINLCADFIFQSVHDILSCDRSKCFARLAGLQCENKPCFADAARQLLSLIQLPRLALSALLLERIKLAQCGRSDFVGHAARQKVIARVPAAHFDYVGFGTEPRDIFGQDEAACRSAHPELHPARFADHILVPWWIPHELHISFIDAVYAQNFALRIVRDGRAHPAARGGQSHFYFHSCSAIFFLAQATIVD